MENETTQIPYIEPATLRVRLDSRGRLEGEINGVEVKNVRARAAFPFTRPDCFIELRSEAGDLLGFIRSLGGVEPESAAAAAASARLGRFVPRIVRVLSIKGRGQMRRWSVETDRGGAEFSVRGRRQNMEEAAGGEHIVTDTEGNRYRIPAVPELDARSLFQLRKVL